MDVANRVVQLQQGLEGLSEGDASEPDNAAKLESVSVDQVRAQNAVAAATTLPNSNSSKPQSAPLSTPSRQTDVKDLLELYVTKGISAKEYDPGQKLPLVCTNGDLDIYSSIYSQRLTSTSWMPIAMWSAPCCNAKVFSSCSSGECATKDFPMLVPESVDSNRNLCTRGHLLLQKISLRLRLQRLLETRKEQEQASSWWDRTLLIPTTRTCKIKENCAAFFADESVVCEGADGDTLGECKSAVALKKAKAPSFSGEQNELSVKVSQLWKQVQPDRFDEFVPKQTEVAKKPRKLNKMELKFKERQENAAKQNAANE